MELPAVETNSVRIPGAPPPDQCRPIKLFLHYNRPYWRAYAVGGILSLFFIVVGLCLPLVIKSLVASLEKGAMTHASLLFYSGVLVLIPVASGIARYFQRSLMIGASRRFEYDLRNAYYAHVQRLSQDFFHRIKTGDIMARATNDMNYVRLLVGPGIMGSVDIIRVPLSLAVMFYLSARLTLIALLPMPFVSLVVYGFVMYLHRQSKIVQEQFSDVTSRAQENLAGARVVKAYGASEREQEAFERESVRYMWQNMKLSAVMSMLWPLIAFIMGVTVLLVLWRGGVMVVRGELELGNLLGLNFCLVMAAWPMVQFGWVLSLYQRGMVSMGRVAEVLREVPTIRDTENTRHEVTKLQGAIRFENVCFGYEDAAVLDHVDFEIPRGSTTAIVGPTGCGKSSVVSLLVREYDPTSGRVCVDDIDIRELPVQLLRSGIGCVPQDTFLFSDTIRANLTFGRPEATDAELDAVSDLAQFAEVIKALDDGYETLLGERGVNLSGGQKQRLAIARAVLRDPQVLVLDDALSSVDTHTEEQILQQLKRVMAERTCVLISHRISTVKHADQILVLEEGRIVARGTHQELLEQSGIYARMYERQLLEDAIEKE